MHLTMHCSKSVFCPKKEVCDKKVLLKQIGPHAFYWICFNHREPYSARGGVSSIMYHHWTTIFDFANGSILGYRLFFEESRWTDL